MKKLQLLVNANKPSNFGNEIASLCDGNYVTLQVAPSFSSYLWSTGETANSIKVTAGGNYSVTVKDQNTCEATKNFKVLISGIPTITSVEINDFQDNNNTILINVTGLGDYEFSLDGIHFQDSSYFTGVLSGEYTVWAKDKNGCGSASKKVYVLNYPKYFTPNGDGYNDFWTIENISVFPGSKIYILDRYGKFIYQFKGGEKGWDGKYDSINLPADDYWFTITLNKDKTIKGHFALKR